MIRKNQRLLQLVQQLAKDKNASSAIIQRKLQAGQQLIQQHQPCRQVYIIQSGVVKCFVTEDNGKEYILEFLGEGEVLGEIEALRKTPAFSSVEALTPLVLYAMSTSQFHHFLQTMPEFSKVILELLATRVANAALKSATQQLYTISHTLPQLLSALQAQGIHFTKQDLSQYLGISVRSLNRLLKTIEN